MAQQEFCEKCNQQHNCQEIYQKLGNSKGPSVAPVATIGFLLPILVFILSLAVFKGIFARTIDSKIVQTALCFLLALSASFVSVLLIKAVSILLSKNK